MHNHNNICIGIDVSSKKLDIADSNQQATQTISYTQTALKRLLPSWKKINPNLICLEATGGLERDLLAFLHKHKFNVAVVNPRQIRDFARANNQLAKTDSIDARVIARFGQLLNPRVTQPISPKQQEIKDLTARRRQIGKVLVQEMNRLARTANKAIRNMIQQAVKLYKKQKNTIEQQIAKLIEADEQTQRKARIIQSTPGLGPAAVATLIAELPELGAVNRQQIGRLIGVAPTNRDSGTLRGKRTTGGGRKDVRTALFMPTLVATKHNPKIKAYYERLIEKGKPKMVALIAAMRKLITILNVMIRDGKYWNQIN